VSRNWIVAIVDGPLRCKRCGATHQIKLPSPIWEWVAISKEFSDRHANCEEETT
jgi:hypothetical protein